MSSWGPAEGAPGPGAGPELLLSRALGSQRVLAVAFAPDGSAVALSGVQGTLQVWEVR